MTIVLPVLVNRSGGTAAGLGDSLAETIEAAFAQTGAQIALELLDAADMPEALRRHLGKPVIAVGGGDGTIGTAAAILADSTTALAVLPLGTRNHLARQLGVPLDLPGAAVNAVSGQRRRIDLGRAGSRVFVNNASFGLYTRFVRERDAGGSKGNGWRDKARAAWHVLRSMRAQFFALCIDGRRCQIETPLLFVGNNEYSLRIGHVGERESLTDHELSILALPDKGPFEMLGLAARVLVGGTAPAGDFLEYGRAAELVIDGRGTIEGAFDGEVVALALPLKLRTLPNALGVVTPRETAPQERTLTAYSH
jgi:diacylglycerol kinase family enzyme